MKVYSFPRGGILFEDHTAPSKGESVNSYLPVISVISLGSGKKKGYPVVSIGENVREGMIIAKTPGSGKESGNIHATVPGKVIRKISWLDIDGIENEALVIKMDGVFEKLGKKNEVFPWKGISGYDLQKIISDYNIVEMEAAGKPLAEMISGVRNKHEKITLVLRCILDDPWLVADYALCKERIEAVIEGVDIVAKVCQKVSIILIAVSSNEKELGQMLLKEAGKLDIPAALVLTGSTYPQHNRRELELALKKYEKKEGYNFGYNLILGPSVFAAVYDAVVYRKPVLERYVAVGGSAVRFPRIMRARIGTRIGDLIEQCGGFTGKPERIVCGSVLFGKEVKYLDEPIGKTSYAIAALKGAKANNIKQNCINCGECRIVCPVGIDPQNIYKKIIAGENDNTAASCYGCGCCKIICPSDLPLSEVIFEKKGIADD